MKRRSIIPHMTTEQVVALRDGIQYARSYAARHWGVSLSHDQVRDLLLCVTEWTDGRLTADQLRGMSVSDALEMLRPMPATIHQPTPVERMVS